MIKIQTKFIGAVFILFAIAVIALASPVFGKSIFAKSKYATYINRAAGYSVQYPSHWRPHEQEYDASFVYFDYGEDQVSIPDQSTAVIIGPTKVGPDSVYPSENLDKIAKIAVEMIEANRFGNQDLKIRVKNAKIGKMKAKQINHINSFVYATRLEMVTYLFIKDSSVWTIAGPAKESGLKQILKTLKFIPKK